MSKTEPTPQPEIPKLPVEPVVTEPENDSNDKDELEPNSDNIIVKLVRQLVALIEKIYNMIKG